jgi:hypothetical protein
VVFLVLQVKPRLEFEIVVFSSKTRDWVSKVAIISHDREMVMNSHSPAKAVAAGRSLIAWIDLWQWQGVLLCTDVNTEH